MGDFNCPKISWPELICHEQSLDTFSNRLLRTLEEYGLEQSIKFDTRERPGQVPSLIDLIITNDSRMFTSVDKLPGVGKSDHCIIKAELCFEFNKEPEKIFRDYKSANFEQTGEIFVQLFHAVNLSLMNSNELAVHLDRSIKLAVEQSIPMKRLTVKPYNRSLLQLIQLKAKAYKKPSDTRVYEIVIAMRSHVTMFRKLSEYTIRKNVLI